jgi:hypothetical protein
MVGPWRRLIQISITSMVSRMCAGRCFRKYMSKVSIIEDCFQRNGNTVSLEIRLALCFIEHRTRHV